MHKAKLKDEIKAAIQAALVKLSDGEACLRYTVESKDVIVVAINTVLDKTTEDLQRTAEG